LLAVVADRFFNFRKSSRLRFIVKQDKNTLVSPPTTRTFACAKALVSGVRQIETVLFAQARKTVFNLTHYTKNRANVRFFSFCRTFFKKFVGVRGQSP